MSRNGAGVYSLPAGSTVSNGDTSDASDINTPLADIEADLNVARPVVAGGTGASTAGGARTNLGLGSIATQGADAVAITGGTAALTGTAANPLSSTATTSATNAATSALSLNSQSSGTPAAGIGVALTMQAETAAGNTEIGAIVEAITTDVTSSSEDFDLVLKLMAGGAAAAEKFRVKSTGVVDLQGGLTRAATAAYLMKGFQEYTSGSGVYTVPTNVRAILVECLGAGGGSGGCDGQGANTCANSAGGGAGGYVMKWIASPAASYSYAVGALGAAGASGANAGSNGGDTTFSGTGTSITAGGGVGGAGRTGVGGSNMFNGGAGGTATGGDLNVPGQPGGNSGVLGGDPTVVANGGSSMYGAGGVGSADTTTPTAGAAATGKGAGGGGSLVLDSNNNVAGADGSAGYIRITEFY